MTQVQKINEFDLYQILSHRYVSKGPSEEIAYKDILSNTRKFKWRINPSLLNSKCLRLIIDNSSYLIWDLLKSLNLFLICIFVCLSILLGDYKFFLLISIYPLLSAFGISKDWIMLITLLLMVSLRSHFTIENNYFWLISGLYATGYLIKRILQIFITRTILKIAFSDFSTFYKYYSNQLIYFDQDIQGREF